MKHKEHDSVFVQIAAWGDRNAHGCYALDENGTVWYMAYQDEAPMAWEPLPTLRNGED